MAATLDQIHGILTDTGLQNKVRGAMCKTAVNIKNESAATDNHTQRLALAKEWLRNLEQSADEVQKYVIAAYALANAEAEVAAITAMADTDIQAHVDASVSVFIAG